MQGASLRMKVDMTNSSTSSPIDFVFGAIKLQTSLQHHNEMNNLIIVFKRVLTSTLGYSENVS